MRRLFALILAVALMLGLAPAALAEKPAAFVTIGFLPETTDQTSMVIRGTAPAGMTVAIEVNGRLEARVIAGPSMSTYRYQVNLDPGANKVVASVEGTDARTEGTVFRVAQSFGDLKDHWAKADCEMLATLGIVNGIGDGQFGPEQSLTRGQFAKLVVLGLGLKPAENPQLSFTDLATIPDWARGYVAVAVQRGLMNGFDDGTFRANDPVSRGQVAVVAARALRQKGVEKGKGQAKKFKDQDRVPSWASADIELSTSAGLIGDFWGEDFNSDAPATRALAAAVVRRLYTTSK